MGLLTSSRTRALGIFCGAAVVATACIPSRQGNQSGNGGPPPPVQGPYPQAYGNPPPATTTAPPVATAPPAGTARRPPRLTFPGRRPPAPVATGTAVTPPAIAGCGEVDVDGVKIPLDCWSKGYGAVAGASQSVARASFATAAQAVPEYVDHRREGKEGPVRAQRTAGSGAALALASAVDQALFAATPQPPVVSALHLFGRAPVASFADVVKASLDKTITTEAVLPYDEAKACAWGDAAASRLCIAKDRRAPDAADLARAEAAPAARLVGIVTLDGTNIEELRDTIGRGRDVLIALRVEPEAWRQVVRAAEDEPLLGDYVGGQGVHTVTLAGYAKQDGAWFFLVKNNWGPLWGKNGYAWIQEGTLKKNVVGAWVIQATLGAAPPPVATGCPPGFQNVASACVVSAPTQSGTDPGTGLAWACAAAGCTYTWQKGVLGCTQPVCTLACPAPHHLAAVDKTKKTVSCTE